MCCSVTGSGHAVQSASKPARLTLRAWALNVPRGNFYRKFGNFVKRIGILDECPEQPQRIEQKKGLKPSFCYWVLNNSGLDSRPAIVLLGQVQYQPRD